MNNTECKQAVDAAPRRVHSEAFKAKAVAACMRSGVSIAAVALVHGVHPNLLRRWVRAGQMRAIAGLAQAPAPPDPCAAQARPAFVPMQLPAAAAAAGDIRIELRRGATSVSMSWPVAASDHCALWLRQVLQ